MEKFGIFFLCVKPTEHHLQVIDILQNYMKAFIISDKPCRTNEWIVHISDEESEKNGFKNSSKVTIPKLCVAWDKVLYFLCRKKLDLDFVWIVEEDVFIPSIKSILEMTLKYNEFDLVCRSNGINENGNRREWHWKHVPQHIQPPWACSMVCAVGVSRKMLGIIDEYVKKYKSLTFIEFMFNTLAHQNNLNVMCADELSTIEYNRNWTNEQIKTATKWLHPVKNISLHETYFDYSGFEKII